jgi:uncharacterized delta-60 repeat protein
MRRTTSHGRRVLAAACGLALVLASAQAADARLGDPDPSFGGDGIATPNVGTLGSVGSQLEGVAIRPDGRVVAAGWANNVSGFDEPLVVQLDGGGAADATFGVTAPGVTRIASTAPETRLFGVAVDGAGRVLAAGRRAPSSTAPSLPVALRFTANGTPDTSFLGTVGAIAGESRAIVAVPSGALVAGWRGGATQERFFVAKLTETGALDESFADGVGIAEPLGPGARAEAMAVDGAGRILVAGWIQFVLGSETIRQAAIVRLTPTGGLDTSFGDQGVVNATGTNPDGDAVGELHAIEIDAAGRIVAAGLSGRHAYVTRRLETGAPDPSFGSGGVQYGTLAESAALSGLALDGARSIVTGRTFGNTPDQILLGALDPAGAPDGVIGGAPAGWRTFPSPAPGGAEALDTTLGPDGNFYAAGSLSAPNEQTSAFVARFLGNAAPTAVLSAAATATAGAPVTLDAGGSSDPEGEPLRYAFDLDGNGSFEFDGGANPFAATSFSAPGTYTVGVRVTDPRGASATATRGIAVSAAAQPPPRPVLSQQGVARPVRGIIRIRLPGTKQFVRITELTAIPNGTEIDARRGRVLLTVLRNANGDLDAARFYAGRFIFRQGKGAVPLTTLKLSGGSFASCGRKRKAQRSLFALASASAQSGGRKKKPVRKLWGDGRGRFRTRGKWGAATVRGTKWLTQDRCDGTRVKVARGKVDVTDLVRPKRKAKRLRAGDAILIRKPR